MSDFSSASLVTAAKARFGETILRNRMSGAGGDVAKADAQLAVIGASVMSRVRSALGNQIGWPLSGVWPDGSTDSSGTDISGKSYREVWPENLLENAIQLFNWRTLAGSDLASAQASNVGKQAEAYFAGLEVGTQDLGIGAGTEVGPPYAVSSRNRDGSSTVAGVPDRAPLLDALTGPGWDTL